MEVGGPGANEENKAKTASMKRKKKKKDDVSIKYFEYFYFLLHRDSRLNYSFNFDSIFLFFPPLWH